MDPATPMDPAIPTCPATSIGQANNIGPATPIFFIVRRSRTSFLFARNLCALQHYYLYMNRFRRNFLQRTV